MAVATYPSLTELTYVKGVTSAIQTQITAKAPSTAPTFATSITGSYLTASEILITDGSKNIVSAPVATYPSLTELTYLKGATSSLQTQIDALSSAVVLKGTWDASAGTFPGGGSAQAGWSYIVSVGGTVDSVVFDVNDRIVAITDNASTATYAANWFKLDYTDQVLSVFGRTGAISATDGDYSQSLITGLKTSDSPQFTGIELGHATDTTISRVSAGVIAVESIPVIIAGSTTVGQVPTITGSNTYSWQTPSGGSLDVQTFTSSGTWTKPGSGTIALIQAWGGGGSGGKKGNPGAGGGGGGTYTERWIALSSLGATETVTIGAGGVAVTNEALGNSGGSTTFGSKLTAYGGAGGGSGAGSWGGGGGGALSAGSSGNGGSPSNSTGMGAVGASSTSGSVGGANSDGGAGGGGAGSSGNGGTGGAAYNGGAGGGGAAYGSSTTGGSGGAAYNGGAGGGGSCPSSGTAAGTGGVSKNGGAGGAGGKGGDNGTSGSQPGGGGGGCGNSDGGSYSGAGGAGKVIVTVF